MPRYCSAKAQAAMGNGWFSEVFRGGCELVIPMLGIEPGTEEMGDYFSFIFISIGGILDKIPPIILITVFAACMALSFKIGTIYVRKLKRRGGKNLKKDPVYLVMSIVQSCLRAFSSFGYGILNIKKDPFAIQASSQFTIRQYQGKPQPPKAE